MDKGKLKKESKNFDDEVNLSVPNPFAIFKQLDKDGNGKITAEDFSIAIGKIGLGDSIGDSAIKEVFKRLDTNKNGKLDLSDLLGSFELLKDLYEKAAVTTEGVSK